MILKAHIIRVILTNTSNHILKKVADNGHMASNAHEFFTKCIKCQSIKNVDAITGINFMS